MKLGRTAAGALCAAALALACPAALPAEARAAQEALYPVEIPASVAEPGEKVVSVVVPSVVSVVVQTSVVDGTFVGFRAGEAVIENGAQSSVPVRISLTEVQDRAVDGKAMLGYVDMTLVGENALLLAEGAGKDDVLYGSIAPGTSETLGVELAEKGAGGSIPAGSYQVKSTMKVAAVR